MNLADLVRRNRSYRRFEESTSIPMEVLKELIEISRFTTSARNLQPLRYALINDPDLGERVFTTLQWAGYLTDWNGPETGERPSAYIIVMYDTRLCQHAEFDAGIACQTILLAAVEKGLGGCIIGSCNKLQLTEILQLPDYLKIICVLALGKPKETVVIEDVVPDGDIRYYRDSSGIHHVPKRTINELIISINGGNL